VLTGTRMARIGPAVGRAHGPLSDELHRLVHDPLLVISARLRTGLVVGTLFLMSVKPSPAWSLLVLVVAAAAGFGVGQLEVRRRHELGHQNS
jgi:hypothetical protein